MTEKTFHSSSSPKRLCRRGFTLTELAIVLGVIGIILGAIWAAASHTYSNYRTQKAVSQILTIVQSVRSIYSKGVFAAGDPIWLNFTNVLINSNAVPGDMIVPCAGLPWNTGGQCIVNPWNGEVILDTQANWGGAPVSTSLFEIQISEPGPPYCMQFLSALVQSATQNGLVWAYTANTGGVAVTPQTQPSQFNGCGGNIVLQFTLSG